MKEYSEKSRLCKIISLGGSAIAMSICSAAFAQATLGQARTESAANASDRGSSDQRPDQPPPAATRSDIIVTGSRTVKNGSSAPTPVTVVSLQQLTSAAPQSVADGLNQIPSFRGSSRPTTSGVNSTRENAGNFLNLRGLGFPRTLILLDGRRAVPSNGNGVTDINIIPQELLQRVDVVTGGASAAYGSDAVAGVVNFVLDTKFKGLNLAAQSGISSRGDGGTLRASAAVGQSFADGRGHIIASASYYRSRPIDDLNGRNWALARPALITNPGAGPTSLLRSGVRIASATFGGLIPSGPLGLTQFLPGGQTAPFNVGTLRSGLTQVGGDGAVEDSQISAGQKIITGFLHARMEVAPGLTVYGQGLIAKANTRYVQLYPFFVQPNGFTIFSGNAFLPAAVQAQMTQANISSFTLQRINRDFGKIYTQTENRTIDLTTGFEWSLGGGWQLSGYYEHGQNRYSVQTKGNVIHRNIYEAVDAVRDPATGQIVCRSVLLGLNDGCQPLNLFGEGAPSASAIDYVTGTAYSRSVATQDVASLSVRGDAFSLWADPVSVAAGIEYRREEVKQVADPISASRVSNANGLIRGIPSGLINALGGFLATNPQPLAGHYDIKEGFLEANVPIVKDQRLLRALSLNGAVRLTDYSTSGKVTTWKAGIVYEPVADLKLRATRSRDIRAANISELFTSGQSTTGAVRDPQAGNASVPYRALFTGNPNLKPEKADTTTFGAIVQPHWIPGLMMSVDRFNVKVKDAITSLTVQQEVDSCAAGVTSLCALIERSPSGAINLITIPNLNIGQFSTKGIDFEGSYVRPLGQGTLSLRALFTRLESLATQIGTSPRIERAGSIGVTGTPKWSGLAALSYDRGAFSALLQERYIGPGSIDTTLTPATIDNNHVPAVFYTDVTMRLSFADRRTELFVTVNNAFDKDPPKVPSAFPARATNFALYDALGRYATVGVKMKF